MVHWLDGSPRRFKTYVGKRVSAILDRLPAVVWRHVPTWSNPADCASRGLLPKELIEYSLWWKGPNWLLNDSASWPMQPIVTSHSNTMELKAICNVASTSELLEERYSSYTNLIRMNAWIQRFRANLASKRLGKVLNLIKTLSTDELKRSETCLLIHSQEQSFPEELRRFHTGNKLRSSSILLSLNPILGPNGLLMVGGRLKNSFLSLSQHHPIILHGRDILAKLIVFRKHLSLLHAGPTLLLSVLGRRFHIIGSRRLIRSVCHGCVTCCKVAAKTETQVMGQLPVQRVTPSSPFSKTGVDFAGPFLIKKGHTRKPVYVKSYICMYLFVSLSKQYTWSSCLILPLNLSLLASDDSFQGEVSLQMYSVIMVQTS